MFEISDIDIKNEIKWNRKNGIVPEEAKTDFFSKSLISSHKYNYIEIKKAGNLYESSWSIRKSSHITRRSMSNVMRRPGLFLGLKHETNFKDFEILDLLTYVN